MATFSARITVTLKNGVLDPQGQAIEQALAALEFDGVASVRQGKLFEIEVTAPSKKQALNNLNSMAEKLLANMVIEEFKVEIDP